MSVSIAKIDQRISEKRRALKEAIDSRESQFEAVDGLLGDIEALEAVESPTDEQANELKEKQKQYTAETKSSREASDSIRKLEAEVRDLDSQKAEREEHIRQSASLPGDRRTAPDSVEPNRSASVTVSDPTDDQKDHDISSFFRNSYIGKLRGMSMADVCAGRAGEEFRNDRLHGAVTQSSNPAILPTNYSTRLIELLRPKSICRSLEGVRQIPLPNGNMRLPRQSAASSASYSTAELANIPTSDVATEPLSLSAKKLVAMVIQSGELMRHSNPSSDAIIRDDIVKVMSLKEDVTFIRSAGSAVIPKGLKAFADAESATQVISSNQTVNLANVTNDLGKLILALRNANCPMIAPVFILSPRSERFLMDLRDGNGNYAFPEMARGLLRGYPFKVTTQIPDNLTVSSVDDTSEIYLVDATEFIIADTDTFELNVSTEAAYHDGSNVQAAFSQDAAVFRCIVEHDTLMRHDESVAYLNQVIWGL